ncbi:hypothetical protein NDU88_001266 [Pleurodeles waltl]|uniref:Uncharacterized protein n=1 Tax=Pleurodeles waltl TaxID=8319 RepID=A0AAV7V927_PLEWA|nr:hypothetical protein NDU88_001266 [Pleurodeles waltl]
MILQTARSAPPVQYENTTITFFVDFTMHVQKLRCNFLEVKKVLRDRGLKYSMMFPTKVRVVAEGKTWYFEKPQDTFDWLEGWRTVGTLQRKTHPGKRQQGTDRPEHRTSQEHPREHGCSLEQTET